MTSKFRRLTEAPTTIIRVEDLIAKKDAEYPKDPARNVCNGAEDPVTTRAGNSGSVRIQKLCNPTDKLSSPKKQQVRQVRPDSLNQDVDGIEIEKGLEGQMCENDDRK